MIWAIVAALLLWAPGSHNWQALWVERWGLVVVIIGLSAIHKLRWRHWILQLAISYVYTLSVIAAFKRGWGIPVPWDLTLMLQHSSLYWLACLHGFLLFLYMPMRPKEFLFPLQIGALIVTIFMMFSKASNIEVPILGNPSIAASYVVLMSFWGSRWWLLMGVIACITSMAVAPTVGFAAGVVLLLMSRRRTLGVLAFVAMAALSIMYLRIPGVDSGRFAHWNMYLDWLTGQSIFIKLFGTGLGTTKVILPYIGLQGISSTTTTVTVAPWLHNDWLQWLGEAGLVGVLIMLTALIKLFSIMGSRGRVAMVVYGTIATINFPSHYALLALSLWGIVKFGALERKPYEIY